LLKAIRFMRPDRIPIVHGYLPAALFEHGEKFRRLWREFPGDSGDPSNDPIPSPDPADILEDGQYRHVETDIWSVTWENRIFGIHGLRLSGPLDDLSNLENYRPPVAPKIGSEDFRRDLKVANEHKAKGYYLKMGWISIWETMRALRRFERCLMDIKRDTREINTIADLITGYQLEMVKYYLSLGVDGIQFGDDWGTQRGLMISPVTWRQFFRPRYELLVKPIKKAGKEVWFHTCGQTILLMDDFSEIGVDVIWPQFFYDQYNMALAEKLRELRMCLLADVPHIDNCKLMQFGTLQEVDAAVKSVVDLFGQPEGGLIFFGEIVNGIPLENIRALFQAFYKYVA